MTVQALTDLDVAFGWDSNETSFADLKSVIQELQGLHFTVASGQVNASVGMTVSGIATTDTILCAWEVPTAIASVTNLIDRTNATSISAANTVICTDGLSTTSLFMVLWFDKSGR